MASNPLNPSFRYPANIPSDAAHPAVVKALSQHTKGLVDVNQAIVALKAQMDLKVGTTPTGTASSSGSTTIINGGTVNFPGLGAVNNQVGQTAYTIQSIDNGALVMLGATTPISVTLNSALFVPYFTTISNAGTSTVTVTPSTGTVNGLPNLTIPGGSWTTIYFDKVNWTADSPGATVGGVSQIIAGTNVTISPTTGIGAVTINATGGGGGGGVSSLQGETGALTLTSTGGTVAITTPTATSINLEATGGGSGYSLGGTLSNANVTLGAGAGTGASLGFIQGLDGNHYIHIITGTSPTAGATLYTLTYTASRGHVCYPILVPTEFAVYSGLDQIPNVSVAAPSATQYSVLTATVPLVATSDYFFCVSCP